VTQQFSQYVEKTTNKIQELLEQVRDEDDITKVSEIYDEVANHADKAASQLNQINNHAGGQERGRAGKRERDERHSPEERQGEQPGGPRTREGWVPLGIRQ
jgi:hypothetical protein